MLQFTNYLSINPMEGLILATVDFVQKIDFNQVFFFIGLGVVVFWLSVAVWVWKDATSRYKSPVFPILFALMTIVFSVFGYLAYVVIRPKDTIEDKYWNEREKEFLMHEIGDYDVCPNCHFDQIFVEFLRCPKCGYEIRHKCEECSFALNKHWKHCPSCGKDNPHFDSKIESHPEHVMVGEIEKKADLVADDNVQALELEKEENVVEKPQPENEAKKLSPRKSIFKTMVDIYSDFFNSIGKGVSGFFAGIASKFATKKKASTTVNSEVSIKETKSEEKIRKEKEKAKRQKKRKRKAKKAKKS